MENWKDNNLSAILEYPFDFERYMEERLREIDDLDERKFAKKLLLEGLGKVIQCTEAKYQQLERRVYEELEIEDNQYEVVLTIVKRSHYDPTNGTLFPVSKEDLDEKILKETRSDGSRRWLGSIFLEASDDRQRDFQDRTKFTGTLVKAEENRAAAFEILPAMRYREVMEGLYLVFQDNHIPWDTINTGYLDKFYDVFIYIEGTEPAPDSLEEVTIDFEEYKEDIRYGLIPLWNLEWVTFDSADFMLPCINGIYYEHEFSLEDKDEKDGYLIQSNEDILEIRHEKNKIVIKSLKETFENWKALHLVQKETVRSLDYNAPLLTNRKRDSFIRRYAENSRVQLMTKTDLFRRIMELDIRDYIEVVGYEICENARDFPNTEGMNWFVRDELFPMESRKVLLLKFKERQPGHYLNGSMVRFVISQMQLEISEYRCVGVIA
ncbi:hypothetical protein ADH76_33120 [Enterocloster clostridioformis]|uniref:hypothetical protein n=1 Tax=Enterocloster clostridioformis TaxID=1531 RepID=UPI00080C575A|nr:hypothetical protein [Enterocloster clostridioformis]ANU49083.1 hypothetical protein A4V08_27955 [Lachnoclostridium sp. YL32]NDO29516.1 hypothetical protein [Enterocloster clostridioformis]OXE61958.1 hypothetical protein ADH76_33120 [Enterocloster clostridioformis]QQR01993.1 hypothetical protein I5Q83_06715 [Enterocloster clostridioformis]